MVLFLKGRALYAAGTLPHAFFRDADYASYAHVITRCCASDDRANLYWTGDSEMLMKGVGIACRCRRLGYLLGLAGLAGRGRRLGGMVLVLGWARLLKLPQASTPGMLICPGVFFLYGALFLYRWLKRPQVGDLAWLRSSSFGRVYEERGPHYFAGREVILIV